MLDSCQLGADLLGDDSHADQNTGSLVVLHPLVALLRERESQLFRHAKPIIVELPLPHDEVEDGLCGLDVLRSVPSAPLGT